jgi:hypothetical protein
MDKNGFDVDQFGVMVGAIEQQPDLAKLTFRSRFDGDAGFAGEAHVEAIGQPCAGSSPGRGVRRDRVHSGCTGQGPIPSPHSACTAAHQLVRATCPRRSRS